MNKLCCVINGKFNCSDCKRPLCEKHILCNRTSPNAGVLHKVQRCLQCHRKFVQPHRTGDTRIPELGIWYAQISRRQRNQGKVVMAKPRTWFGNAYHVNEYL